MASTNGLDFISELAQRASTGNYLFRGETRHNSSVSSRLFRDNQNNWREGSDIELFQRADLDEARKFTHETDDFTILTEIQHYGGSTNLIDFTTDCFIALFFACDGDHEYDGRLILLDMYSNMRMYFHRPNSPENRVISQKSIFVRPPLGYVEEDFYEVLKVPACLKEEMLDYLRNSHGISTESIYNDLHGFIRSKAIHVEAENKFSEGLGHHNNGELMAAIEAYTESLRLRPDKDVTYNNRGVAYKNLGDMFNAERDLDKAIALNSRNGYARYNRGTTLMISSRWQDAKTELTLANEFGMNVREMFIGEYTSVDEFQTHYSVQVPEDIVNLLTGH